MATMNLLNKNPAKAGRDTAGQAGGVAAFDRRVIVVGAVVFAVLLAVSTRYGFHRDELYFIDTPARWKVGSAPPPAPADLQIGVGGLRERHRGRQP